MSLQTIGRRDLKAENIGNFIVSHHISASCCKDKTFFLTHTISPKLFKVSSNNLYMLYTRQQITIVISATPVYRHCGLICDAISSFSGQQ